MKKQNTLTKRYLDNKFLSHTIVPLEGTNLPSGIQDPADEQQTEDEFEAERERREDAVENQNSNDL